MPYDDLDEDHGLYEFGVEHALWTTWTTPSSPVYRRWPDGYDEDHKRQASYEIDIWGRVRRQIEQAVLPDQHVERDHGEPGDPHQRPQASDLVRSEQFHECGVSGDGCNPGRGIDLQPWLGDDQGRLPDGHGDLDHGFRIRAG